MGCLWDVRSELAINGQIASLGLSRDVGKGYPWDVLGTNVCRLGIENESNTENNNRVLNENYQTLLVKFTALGNFIK